MVLDVLVFSKQLESVVEGMGSFPLPEALIMFVEDSGVLALLIEVSVVG